MARVAYYVHGRGRGHASRSRPILEALAREGHELHVRAGGPAARALEGPWGLAEVASVLPGLASVLVGVRRGREDARELRRLDPDLVVTDGDAPGLHAARWLGIPTIAVGHGLVFGHCRLPPGLPADSVAWERVNAGSSSWGADRIVAVHFAAIEAGDARTRVARPDRDPLLAGTPPREDFFLAYFRDGNGAAWLEAVAARGAPIRCYGDAAHLPRGVEGHAPDRASFARDLLRCRGILGSAGSNLLAEAVLTRTPILALHGRRDHEQRLNALLVERAGAGLAGCLGDPSAEIIERWYDYVTRGPVSGPDLEALLPPASAVVAELVSSLGETDRTG